MQFHAQIALLPRKEFMVAIVFGECMIFRAGLDAVE
jgi:hypothetical protein